MLSRIAFKSMLVCLAFSVPNFTLGSQTEKKSQDCKKLVDPTAAIECMKDANRKGPPFGGAGKTFVVSPELSGKLD